MDEYKVDEIQSFLIITIMHNEYTIMKIITHTNKTLKPPKAK